MIDTVIFDLDGTLLFTLEDLTASTNFALANFNYPKRTEEEVRYFVGNGVQKLIERAIPNGSNNPDFGECLTLFKKNYADNMYNKTRVYDGVPEMLEAFESQGYKIGVVSNKFHLAVDSLCKKYFGAKIKTAIGESDKVRKKPAPDSVFEAIERLGSDVSRSVYVGDSEVDIQTAKAAGIPCVSVDWGYKDRAFLAESGADRIVSTPAELVEAIVTLENP